MEGGGGKTGVYRISVNIGGSIVVATVNSALRSSTCGTTRTYPRCIPAPVLDLPRVHARVSVYRVNTERRIGLRPFIGEIERERTSVACLSLYIHLPITRRNYDTRLRRP